MKKTLWAFALVTLLISCKKDIEETEPEMNSSSPEEVASVRFPGQGGGFSIANNRIIFETIAEYEWLIDNATESQKNQFVSDFKSLYGYKSLNDFRAATNGSLDAYSTKPSASKDNAEIIDEDFFGEILNPDGVVEIGPYLIKVDGVNGYCYVMSNAYINEYDDLVKGNLSNPHVQSYLNDDDVLEILQVPDPERRCKEKGAPHKKWDEDYYLSACNDCDIYVLDCKIVYQKLGIHFSLTAKAKWFKDPSFLGQWSENAEYLGMKYIVKYKPKCQSETTECDQKTATDAHVINDRPYAKSRGLNAYWYEVDFIVGEQAVYGYISFYTNPHKIDHVYTVRPTCAGGTFYWWSDL